MAAPKMGALLKGGKVFGLPGPVVIVAGGAGAWWLFRRLTGGGGGGEEGPVDPGGEAESGTAFDPVTAGSDYYGPDAGTGQPITVNVHLAQKPRTRPTPTATRVKWVRGPGGKWIVDPKRKWVQRNGKWVVVPK